MDFTSGIKIRAFPNGVNVISWCRKTVRFILRGIGLSAGLVSFNGIDVLMG
jgi:hypothetical protein